jgi:hypothetical protein
MRSLIRTTARRVGLVSVVAAPGLCPPADRTGDEADPAKQPDWSRNETAMEEAPAIQVRVGAKVVTHARYVSFQMAKVAVPKRLFRAILERIRRLRLPETVPG